MVTNYYNPNIREHGHVETTKHDTFFVSYYRNERGSMERAVARSFEEADKIMNEHGYERVGFRDESGCMRYTMTLSELQAIYKRLEKFVADCTQQECEENKQAIIAVFTLLHKHINAEASK